MTPKEDQQPMTTREELVALRDWIRRPDYAEEFSFDDIVDWINERPVATVERLASRQEVSVTVEELALELMNARRRMTGLEELSAERVKKIGLWPLKEETMCAARALIAKYSITKRTTEG